MPAVRGIDRGLKFIDSDPAALAASDIDLFFLALPHGAAATYAKALVAGGKRVIDLSADFRIADLATYQKYYGEHHAPELLPSARFVLPELTPPVGKRRRSWSLRPVVIRPASRAARAAAEGGIVIAREHIVVNSFSGVSGAGKKVEEMYLFVERAESAKAYGLTKHRHLAEIEEQLALHTGAKTIIQFNPHLAPMRRGIATTITVPAAAGATIETALCRVARAYGIAVRADSAERGNARHGPRRRHEPDRHVRRARSAHRQFRDHLRRGQPHERRQRPGRADHEPLVRV